jgi:REP element-mobilizing transposase RayT
MPNHVHGIIIIEKTVSDVAVSLHPASESKSLFRILSPSRKTAHFSPFFTFFQLCSTGYAPSKTQKLTKNQPVFATDRES